ncbi:MAG: CopG family transcriptional regulator [Candidatus Krumholzibacteriaceae bacterium]|jgi:predicted DNA binding CopG/RHH family protein
MKKRIRYTDEPLGDFEIVEDFLPPPEELIHAPVTVKVTISLSLASIDFFKRAAEQNNTQYQKLIRRVLDLYAAWYTQNEERAVGRKIRSCGAAVARERKGRRSR